MYALHFCTKGLPMALGCIVPWLRNTTTAHAFLGLTLLLMPTAYAQHTISPSAFLVLFAFLISACTADAPAAEPAVPQVATSTFDAALAERLGADPYGMRSYVMAFLKAGPNRDQDSLAAAEIQAAHMANIRRMAEAGQLVLAGPFLDSGDYQGIYLFNVPTIEEAEALTATDPAVQAGRLVMELHPWYGSAALMQVNEVHTRIARENP